MNVSFEIAVTRRRLLRTATCSAAAAARRPAYAADDRTASLRAAAMQAGLLYGSTSDVEFTMAPPDYAALFVRNCGLFAPQMGWTRSAIGQFGPDPGWQDPNILFARQHGMHLTGGCLLWHETTPPWFETLPSRSAAELAVSRHIAAMTRTFAPLIYSWNVVNEAIEPQDGRPDGLRNTQLLRKLGPDYIPMAFSSARESAPNALLVYNENGLEFDRRDEEARRTALLRLLDKLQSVKAPIDAVGLQSHLRLDGTPFDAQIYRNFLREIAGRKLTIIISELDVLDVEPAPTIAARDANVASLYRAFLDTALDERAVKAVVTWGLVDRYSWLNLWHLPIFSREDGQPTRPLLFDDSLQPKPAFDAVLSAFRRAPPRANALN